MQAIGKYIVIKKINEEYKSDSGLLLSSADIESFRYHKGEVINPGTNVEVIKQGDVIYFDKSSGHTMFLEDESYTIIEERNVVIVL
jgi:co-chaperonin GroES (HSP10)|tara:strand:+ start:419 stop:676 length:258 start_codon:yes stop_codon:yes gene_type:complete